MEKTTNSKTIREVRRHLFDVQSILPVFINNKHYSVENARRVLFEQKNQERRAIVFPSPNRYLVLVDLD